MNTGKFKMWCGLGMLALTSSSALAMIVQNFSIDDITPTMAGTVNTVVVNQSYTAALGTTDWAELQSVQVSVTATVTAMVQVENTDTFNPAPVTFTFQYQPTVNVGINGGPNVFTGIAPEANGSYFAGPFDGLVDFAGVSGTDETLSGVDSDSTTYNDVPASPLTFFEGGGTVQLDFTTFLQDLSTIPYIFTTPAGKPIAVGTNVHDVDITGSVTYTFAPEPGTLVLMVSVFGIAGVLRRRRLQA